MKTILSLALVLITLLPAFGQDLSNYERIASYPFTADGNDATGNYDPALIYNGKFKDGGIYSNGIYYGNDRNGSLIRSANITGLSMEKHAVTLEFNADAANMPLITFGDSWRWLYVYIKPDSSLELFANKNDGSAQVIYLPAKIDPGKWYKMGVVYDSASGEIAFYLDDVLVKKDALTAPYKHSGDLTFANQHAGIGITFRGYWRNLNIYNEDKSTGLVPEAEESLNIGFDPMNRSLYFDRLPGHGLLEIYDMSGRLCAAIALNNSGREFLPENIRNGIYIVRFRSRERNFNGKILVY